MLRITRGAGKSVKASKQAFASGIAFAAASEAIEFTFAQIIICR